MARVITFSRTFPSYHPRAGEPTYFVEKVLRSVHDDEHLEQLYRNWEVLKSLNMYEELGLESIGKFQPKHHTIRAGHRWKVGDWFSPRVWGDDVNPKSGKKGPYHSKQITIAPDIEIKKVWDFKMDYCGVCSIGLPGEKTFYTFEPEDKDETIARNDGLSLADFYMWFSTSPEFNKNEGFKGQIICWNENIEY